MTHFTADTDNNITAHATAAEAKASAGTERFSSEAALAKLAANWPATRLVEIYNSLTGVTAVKKFKDRSTAAARIWTAIQSLGQPVVTEDAHEAERQPESNDEAPVAGTVPTAEPEQEPAPVAQEGQQTPDAAPVAAPTKKKAASAKKAPAAKETREPKGTRAGSKTETVLALMKQRAAITRRRTRLDQCPDSASSARSDPTLPPKGPSANVGIQIGDMRVSRQLDRLAKVAVEKRPSVPIPGSMSDLAMMRNSGVVP